MEHIIKELQSTNSKNEKLAILEKYKDDETFQKVLQATYNKRITYGVGRAVLDLEVGCGTQVLDSEWGWANTKVVLNALRDSRLSGNEAKDAVIALLALFQKESQDIVRNILLRDLKCGISANSINKVFGKNFIPKVAYMGCTSYSKKKVDNLFKKEDYLISQVKMDGLFCNAVFSNDGALTMQTRQGTDFGENFLKYFRTVQANDVVLNGEITIPGMDRQTSNGIVNSYLKNPDLPIVHKLVYTVWDSVAIDDYISGYSDIVYIDRFTHTAELVLSQLIDSPIDIVEVVDHRLVKTVEEAHKHFTEMVKAGEEGTVLKSPNGTWKDGKPVWQIKFKPEEFYDLEIKEFNFGKIGTKNEHRVSSLLVTSSDGLLQTRAQGLKEAQMDHITANFDEYLGKIAKIKCSGLSSDRDGNFSLMSPVFLELHDSKEVADSLEQCKEIHNMNLGIDNLINKV